MSFRAITRAGGLPAVADDMSPRLRALAMLLDHANQRETAGIIPPACPCDECWRHRDVMQAHLPPEQRTKRP